MFCLPGHHMPGTPRHCAAAVMNRIGFPVRFASAKPSVKTPYHAMPGTTFLLLGTLPPYEAPAGDGNCATTDEDKPTATIAADKTSQRQSSADALMLQFPNRVLRNSPDLTVVVHRPLTPPVRFYRAVPNQTKSKHMDRKTRTNTGATVHWNGDRTGAVNNRDPGRTDTSAGPCPLHQTSDAGPRTVKVTFAPGPDSFVEVIARTARQDAFLWPREVSDANP